MRVGVSGKRLLVVRETPTEKCREYMRGFDRRATKGTGTGSFQNVPRHGFGSNALRRVSGSVTQLRTLTARIEVPLYDPQG